MDVKVYELQMRAELERLESALRQPDPEYDAEIARIYGSGEANHAKENIFKEGENMIKEEEENIIKEEGDILCITEPYSDWSVWIRNRIFLQAVRESRVIQEFWSMVLLCLFERNVTIQCHHFDELKRISKEGSFSIRSKCVFDNLLKRAIKISDFVSYISAFLSDERSIVQLDVECWQRDMFTKESGHQAQPFPLLHCFDCGGSCEPLTNGRIKVTWSSRPSKSTVST
jgi:hypothetical protein